MLRTLLLILLITVADLVPCAGLALQRRIWGYYPSGGAGLILVVLVVLIVFGAL